jgi:hypothetical protein
MYYNVDLTEGEMRKRIVNNQQGYYFFSGEGISCGEMCSCSILYYGLST